METGIVLGTQVALYLVFVAECLQAATGHQELFGLRGHTVIAQQVAEQLKVPGLIDPRILRNLREIGEGAPLTLLVGQNGRMVRHCRLIVAWEEQLLVVIVITRRGMLVPIQSAGTSLDMIFRAVIPCPAATDTGTGIDLCGVVLFHGLHPFVTVADPVASGFVAGGHHHKRRVVSVFIDDALGLVHQILVDLLSATQFDTMVGPRRTLGLQIDAYTVGSDKGSLWRTIAVETHMVQTILLALAEYA